MKCSVSDAENLKKLLELTHKTTKSQVAGLIFFIKWKSEWPKCLLLPGTGQHISLEQTPWRQHSRCHTQTPRPCSVLFLFCRSSLLFDTHKVILQFGSLWLEAWQAAVPGTLCQESILRHHDNKNSSKWQAFFFFHITKYLNPGRAFPALQALSISTQNP